MAEITIIKGGTVHDGRGGDGYDGDVVVRDGVVAEIVPPGSTVPDGDVIDASGCWVTPGFVDLHTHYDAEVEVTPGLSESVRHGVTSVLVGSCGLSMAIGDVEDLADMFCRVEGIPREFVLPLLRDVVTWETPGQYLDHLQDLPLGPNVTAMLGHSTVRAHVMGLERSLSNGVKPTRDELLRMGGILQGAMDAGFLGLSINTLPWDKMDGDRFRSRPTPSVYASWDEYRFFTRILRAYGGIFQGVPNVSTKVNLLRFMAESSGIGRDALRTMVISMADLKFDRTVAPAVGAMGRITNTLLQGDLRFQSLPVPFDMYVDGLEVPIIEEFGAGTSALSELDGDPRSTLLRDPAFRDRFRKEWTRIFPGRAYHRDLDEATILDCPDAHLNGRTFGDIAREQGRDPIDTFLDLQADHGTKLRWYTVIANDRIERLRWIMAHPDVLIGFSDAGAHLRNMAFYNFSLRMLLRVMEADDEGVPFMTVGRAIHRNTAEIAGYLGIDGGLIAEGRPADLTVIDPVALRAGSVEGIHTAPMEGFGPLERYVRRNDDVVRATLVNGTTVWREGEASPTLGIQAAGQLRLPVDRTLGATGRAAARSQAVRG
ncbi:MAG: N-acyl-D-aspartate/D-glutamate deacylase [Nitriliruptoraceae bacterium]|jgi:N-acyl-D-aspartate/D-glutamate deacylase